MWTISFFLAKEIKRQKRIFFQENGKQRFCICLTNLCNDEDMLKSNIGNNNDKTIIPTTIATTSKSNIGNNNDKTTISTTITAITKSNNDVNEHTRRNCSCSNSVNVNNSNNNNSNQKNCTCSRNRKNSSNVFLVNECVEEKKIGANEILVFAFFVTLLFHILCFPA